LYHTWAVSKAWLLWIVLWWTLVYRCLNILLGRYQGALSLGHMAVLSLAFWGISILLSIVVVLICIPTNSIRAFLFRYIFASIHCC
jgi:hypothetical protein